MLHIQPISFSGLEFDFKSIPFPKFKLNNLYMGFRLRQECMEQQQDGPFKYNAVLVSAWKSTWLPLETVRGIQSNYAPSGLRNLMMYINHYVI